MTVYRNYINGEWSESASTRAVENVNPANTDDVLGTTKLATRAEARAAIDAAEAARIAWRMTPAPVRGKTLLRAAQLLESGKDELAQLMTREQGKTLKEARGEIQRAVNIIEFCAGETRRINGETIQSEIPANLVYTLKQPVGVVACITPWNFPVAIPAWKIAPALAAGNTVVFKPATLIPAASVRLVEIFEAAGIPRGVLNLVIGSGGEAGDEIINHPSVRAVTFTGSTAIGMKLYEQVAGRGAKAQCEMGGKNPIVVMDDADLELAAKAAASGAFGSTGQRCSATSRAIVIDKVANRFVQHLKTEAERLRVGDGSSPDVDMGPSVDKTQFETVLGYINAGREDGATLVTGGEPARGKNLDKGFFIRPTVFDNVTPEMRIAREEIFGPVLSVLRVRDFDEALRVANDSDYGLSSAIFTKDSARIFRFAEEIETGVTHINSPTTGGEAHVPFGGLKQTGIGSPRELGSTALDFYTELKVVYVDYTGGVREGNLY